MRRKYLFILLALIPCYLFSEIQYPESLYVEYKETKYRILLGSIYHYVEEAFGIPLEKKMLFREASDAYEIWELRYSDFNLTYSTYHNKIIDITILNDTFKTSLNIEIGDSEEDVIKVYGNPSEIIYRFEKMIIYDQYIPEINSDGQYTRIMFEISNGIVTRIIFYIDSLA